MRSSDLCTSYTILYQFGDSKVSNLKNQTQLFSIATGLKGQMKK